MENQRKTGFVPPIIDETHHVFGGANAIPLNVIKADGDWRSLRSNFESQLQPAYDTSGCTVFGTLKAICKLEKFLYGTNPNYSERFTYNEVGIVPPGSDPHLVAAHIKGAGLLNQEDLPNDVQSLAEFMIPRPPRVDLRIKAQKWLNNQMLGHQWLWEIQPDQETRLRLLKDGLLKGTVDISVTAWYKNAEGLYYSPVGQPNEHWTNVEYIDDTGIYVDDSYNDAQTNTNLKKLTLDHNIQFAKVYFLTKPTQQQKWYEEIILSLFDFLKNLVGIQSKSVSVTPIVNQSKIDSQVIVNKPIEVLAIKMPVKYLWDTPEQARHSFRVICDEKEISVEDKNRLCQVLNCESGFKINIVHPNNDARKTTDFGVAEIDTQKLGIAQFNDYWYKNLISPEDALNNPEKACRIFIDQFKAGHLKDWVCYSSGLYKNFKP